MPPILKPSEQFRHLNAILSRRTRHFSQNKGTLNDGFSTVSGQREADAVLVEETIDLGNRRSLFTNSEENLAEMSTLKRTTEGVEAKLCLLHTTQSHSSLDYLDKDEVSPSQGSTAASSEDPFDDCNALSSHSSPVSSPRGVPLPASPGLEEAYLDCAAQEIPLLASPPLQSSTVTSPREIPLSPSPLETSKIPVLSCSPQNIPLPTSPSLKE